MPRPFTTERDPWDWCAVVAVFFLALCWWRLGIPSEIYFDEVHYVKAARLLIEGQRANPEHPMFAKTVIAASIRYLGDSPLYWRVPSALFGALGLFAFSRFVWFASGRATAAIFAALLLATDFFWFIHSRIAMLDMIMAGLGMCGLWMVTAALRRPQQARWRLALAGVLFGLALGSKWSVAPVLVLPGLVFVAMRIKAHGRRFLLTRSGGPIAGISLIEAGLWLGLVPLAVYWLSYWPAFCWIKNPVSPLHPIEWHQYMLQLQDSVKKLHPYRSYWNDWVIDRRAIWYLYREVDGVQRGIVLVGNPFTMFSGLLALGWAAWAGFRERRLDALAMLALYLLTLGMWPLSGKPIQFFYHYLLPSTFLIGALALALEELWRRGEAMRLLAGACILFSLGMFAWFYPIISGAPLEEGKMSYQRWMWVDSWR